jgi:hypothetical protein
VRRAAHLLVVADASRPRQRGGGFHPLVARREAPHNHADQADIGRQSLRLFRRPVMLSHYLIENNQENYLGASPLIHEFTTF